MRWLIVSGCGHTGTTLAAKMLSQSPEVYCNYRENGQFLAYNYFKVDELIRTTEKEATANSKKLILEKTPRHVWHVDYIRSKLIQPKFLFMVREPLATITSLAKRTGDVGTSIRRYQDDCLLILRQTKTTDSLIVRYEDLVRNPLETCKKMSGHAGIEFTENMLYFHLDRKPWFNDEADSSHTRNRNAQLIRPFFMSENTWIDNSNLEPKLEEWYAAIGYKLAEAFGYNKLI